MKKNFALAKKPEMLKTWKLNFSKQESNQNVQLIKKLYFSDFLRYSPATSYYWNVFLHTAIFFQDKIILINLFLITWVDLTILLRWTYYYQQNQTLPAIIPFRPKNSFKTRYTRFTIKLDVHVSKYKDDHISKSLLQPICLVIIST